MFQYGRKFHADTTTFKYNKYDLFSQFVFSETIRSLFMTTKN